MLWCVTSIACGSVCAKNNPRPRGALRAVGARDVVLRYGCRECYVSVLCVKSSPSDRVRPRAERKKNKAKPRSTSLLSQCSPVSYVVRADVCGRFLRGTCFSSAHELEQLRRREGRPVSDVRASARLRNYIHGLLTAHLASAAALRFPAQAAGVAQARNSLGCSSSPKAFRRDEKKGKNRSKPADAAHRSRAATAHTINSFFLGGAAETTRHDVANALLEPRVPFDGHRLEREFWRCRLRPLRYGL